MTCIVESTIWIWNLAIGLVNLRRHAAATIDLFVCLIFGTGYHLTTDLLGKEYIDYRIKYVKTVPGL